MSALEELLLGQRGGVVSFTGGGGKTSLMFHLARELEASGQRVLTTTTTRIFWPTPDQSRVVIVDPDPANVLRRASQLGETGHFTAAAEEIAQGQKLRGFTAEELAVFERSGRFDWILIEADGAARRPLKAPAEHEPVVPPSTTIHVAVAGLEALGQRLCEDVVFRSALAAPRMGLAPGERITEEDLVNLAVHPEGWFKGAPEGAARVIFLNKADDWTRRVAGDRLAGLLLRQRPQAAADRVLVGEALETLRIHAVHAVEQRS